MESYLLLIIEAFQHSYGALKVVMAKLVKKFKSVPIKRIGLEAKNKY